MRTDTPKLRRYDPTTFTYGYELELSDVPRSVVIPPVFGAWEHSERDIVNTRPPHRGVAADPLGESPSVGGEINMVPTPDWPSQVVKIMDLVKWLERGGHHPAVGPTAHGHIHVHVPGLTEDVPALKRLTDYVMCNQADMVSICGRYDKHETMDAKAVRYFKEDGGRHIPVWMCANIQSKVETFEDFIRMHCCGKDGVSRGRPFRYAINMYCLKHTKTVEFRMFRGTLDEAHLACSFEAVEQFMNAALNDGPMFRDLRLGKNRLPIQPEFFAPMQWDKELWDGLQATKHPENRGCKERRYVEVTR